jgi:hypothetical protein
MSPLGAGETLSLASSDGLSDGSGDGLWLAGDETAVVGVGMVWASSPEVASTYPTPKAPSTSARITAIAIARFRRTFRAALGRPCPLLRADMSRSSPIRRAVPGSSAHDSRRDPGDRATVEVVRDAS